MNECDCLARFSERGINAQVTENFTVGFALTMLLKIFSLFYAHILYISGQPEKKKKL